MEAVFGVLVLIMVLFAVAGTVLAVRTARTVRRGVQRNVAQARRVVEETTLRAKTYAQPGALGEVAALRLSLRTSMSGTRQALEAGTGSDPSLREALRLLNRLGGHAHSLDGELRALEREPHRDRITARLPELRRLTERVTHSADSLRWAAQERARQFDEDELGALAREIEIEAGALRHWAPAEAAPGGSAAPAAPAASAVTGPAAVPAAGLPDPLVAIAEFGRRALRKRS